jgi:hypothetical protein
MNVTPISFEYETEFGKLEYWEEVQTVKMDWMDKESVIISPYMKIWIFPSEEFIKSEMQRSMINGEFPGSPEEKAERENEGGFTDEEKMKIRENEDLMELIGEVVEEYAGNADIVLQIVDGEEVVFNLYVQINEEDIVNFKPMSPEEVPAEDVKIVLEWERIYDLISYEEENMRGAELESPPWDKRSRQGMVKGITDGIKMYFKVRGLVNSAVVTPASAEGDVKDFVMTFIRMMAMNGGDDKRDDDRDEGDMKKGEEDEMEKPTMMTGEVVEPVFGFDGT